MGQFDNFSGGVELPGAMYQHGDAIKWHSASKTFDIAAGGGAVTWASITGTPTTLLGYGITDAASDSELAAHATDTTSIHGIVDTASLVVTTDPRLSDARTPTAHATTHQNGGSDELSATGLSGLLADQQTPLTHDILTKHNGFPGGTTNFLRADGSFAAPPSGGTTPTGTGFRHIAAGVEDAAAKLVDTADVNNDQITYAKIQNVSATDRLLGRDTAAAGDIEELTVSGGLEFTGTGIQRSALTGDVTATAGSSATTLAAGSASNLNSGTLLAGRMPALTGDVTTTVGAVATTIANDAVTYAKMQNVSATDKLLGRSTAGAGDPEEIPCTGFARTILDDVDAAAVRTTIGAGTGSGTVTSVSGTAPIASSGGATPAISLNNSGVTYAKLQDVSATDKVLGRFTAGAGVVEEIAMTAAGRALVDDATNTDQRTTLGLGTLATQSGTFSGTHSGTSSGTNTGDQTSIAGITGTTAQFNTALSDGDFATGGGTATGTNTGDQTSIVGITGTLAQFNTALTGADFASGGGTATGANTADMTIAGETYLSLAAQVLTANAVNLSGTHATGTLAAGRFPALTGDLTTGAGALATTLATVNGNVGTFGSATQSSQVTLNGKGLATAASNVTVTPAESSLTTTDITTNNVTSTKHGFAPKSPADATKFLNGAATPDYALVKDSDLSTSDITTNDASLTKHGFMMKFPGGTSNYLRADGTFAAVAGTPPALTEFTKDLGTGRNGGTFDITGLSGLTIDKPVMVIQSAAAIASKGNARDEIEMDQIQLSGYVLSATTIRCYWNATGIVVGTYAFAYLIGA